MSRGQFVGLARPRDVVAADRDIRGTVGRIILAGTLVGLTVAGAIPAAAQVPRDVERLAVEIARQDGHVIVGLRPAPGMRGMRAPGIRTLDESRQAAIAAELEPLGLQVNQRFGLITAIAGTLDTARVQRLLAHPNVEYVVPDYPLRLSDSAAVSSPSALWALIETIPWGVSKIRADQAWALTTPANYGAAIKVAILDAGGDFDHEDLLFAGGFDVNSASTAPTAWDDNIAACGGHGTHVSGTVGARRANDRGYVGVAPEASLYMVKVAHSGQINGTAACLIRTSSVIGGLDWAADQVMRVVNMSLGGPPSLPLQDAVQAAAARGVILVAAAGNDGGPVGYPAAYPEVIAVAATNSSDIRASFSNVGPEVAIAAPGVSVPSTLSNNGYGFLSGTSMASPHVAGVVALLLAHRPSLGLTRVRELLRDGAIDRSDPGRDVFYGDGRVDALNSVGLLLGTPGAPAQLVITRQPGGAVSGGGFAVQPVVHLRDANSRAVAQAGVVVSAALTSGSGQLSGIVTAVTNASGIAIFTDLTITGSGDHTLQFTAPGLPPVTSAVFAVSAATVTALQNGVPVPGLAGAAGSAVYYVLAVPGGQSHLEVTISGGTGNADLYVRQGQVPTQTIYGCRPLGFGNTETCTFNAPAAGDWYIMLRGSGSYSAVTLTAVSDAGVQRKLTVARQPGGAVSGTPLTVQPAVQLRDANDQPLAQAGVVVSVAASSGPGTLIPSATTATTDQNGVATFGGLLILGEGDHRLSFDGPGVVPVVSAIFAVGSPPVTPLENGVPVSGLAGGRNTAAFYVINVPSGQTRLRVTTSDGSGDADLRVQQKRTPTLGDFDCASAFDGNSEVCTSNTPAAGSWYIMLFGFSSYSGVTLRATYDAATQVALTRQPGGAVSGMQLAVQPVVQVQDAAGQPAARAGVVVTATMASGTADLSGPRSATTDSNGVAQFTGLVIIGTGEHTLRFSATGLFSTTSIAFTAAPPPVAPLQNGVPVAGVGAPVGGARFYVIGVPPGAVNARVQTSGGTGNVDLYVRLGQLPTLTTYDCRSANFGNSEACASNVLPAGEWYVMLYGAPGYDNVTLTATFDGSPTSALIVAGGGMGSGTVTSQAGLSPSINCTITNGVAGATGCVASYLAGTSITLTGAAAGGSTFTGWSGVDGGCPGTSPCTVIMDRARTVTASFGTVSAVHTLALVGQGTGSGAVTSQAGLSPAISCVITNGVAAVTGCGGAYPSGTVVTLAALASTGSAFLGWSGPDITCPGLSACTVTMDRARTVTASFAAVHTLALVGQGTGSGTVTSQAGLSPAISCVITNGAAAATGCNGAYPSGTLVTLAATASTGSAFLGWSGPDITCPGLSSCTVIMDRARTITASFTAVHTLALVGQGTGSGTVTSQAGLSPAINCVITNGVVAATGCNGAYPSGTLVTLAAQAAPGSLFLGFGGAGVSCPAGSPCTLVVDQPRSMSAEFLVAPTADVAGDDLLGTPRLSNQERTALDLVGNRNARYDVGDYLALLVRLGLYPSAAELAEVMEPTEDSPRPTGRKKGGRAQ